jgi:YesN/AraC family two-component response regulator
MKVLIVDDNEELAFIIKGIIEDENHIVRTARDGEDGYSVYLHFKPDLVITDIQMPGKNGFELMKDIRVYNPKIRTIYMSGNLSWFLSLLEEEKKRYHASFLGKPFSRVELIKLLSDSRD